MNGVNPKSLVAALDPARTGLLYQATIPDSTPRMAESRMGEVEA